MKISPGAFLLQVGDQLLQALLLYCQNFHFESTLYVGGPLAIIGKSERYLFLAATCSLVSLGLT